MKYHFSGPVIVLFKVFNLILPLLVSTASFSYVWYKMKKIDFSKDDRRIIEWKITKSACISLGSFIIFVAPYALVPQLASSSRNGLHAASYLLLWCWPWICPVIYVFTHPDYLESVQSMHKTVRDSLHLSSLFTEWMFSW